MDGETRKSIFSKLLKKKQKQPSPRQSSSSPFQRSASFRHSPVPGSNSGLGPGSSRPNNSFSPDHYTPSPSPDRLGGDYLSEYSLNDSNRLEELETSIQQKDDIIQRLSAELERTSTEIDRMGRRINEAQNNNNIETSVLGEVQNLREKFNKWTKLSESKMQD